MTATRFFELVCCAILLGIAAALGWAAAGIEPSPFDPIGSGRIPLVLSGLVAVLALTLMIKSATFDEDLESAAAAEQSWRTLSVAVLTVLFVAMLEAGSLPFIPVSAGYLLLVGLILSTQRLRIGRGLRLLAVAIVLPAVLAHLFTHVLYIRLP